MYYPTLDPDDARTKAELPTHWNCANCSQFLEVSKDKRTVKYTGKGNHANDVGAIQANKPVPSRMLLYYYEITVLDAGTRGAIAVGLSDRSFQVTRQPGWEPYSFGYHGDDGKKFHTSGRGEAFGPVFTTGDTVGCGLNFASQEVFYTKNGKMVGIAFRGVTGELFPTVGLHSPGESLSVNFGQLPFKFDLDAMASDIRERRQRAVEEVPLPVPVPNALVRAYLRHYGYAETLAAFEAATSSEGQSSAPEDRLHDRRRLRGLLMEGDVDGAIRELEALFPGLLRGRRDVQRVLECQRVIEAVRRGDTQTALQLATGPLAALREPPLDQQEAAMQGDGVAREEGNGEADGSPAGLPAPPPRPWGGHSEDGSGEGDGDGSASGSSDDEDGFEYGRGPRGRGRRNGRVPPARRAVSEDEEAAAAAAAEAEARAREEEEAAMWGVEAAVGLLAYEEPERSPLRHLLGPQRREAVADAVNSALLAFLGLPGESPLERDLVQLTAVQAELREANGGRGEVFAVSS
eukprot:tig00021312_g20079.t1